MSRRPEEMVGRILANTYAVERLLGRGGMGAVYSARHVRTNGVFAVKVLNPEAAADEEIYRRFQNEARIISALRHPNIVQVTDFDQDDDGTPFLVMELLVGQDLYERLREVERLPLAKALTIARQVGGALHAAHALGIIHRDVKPQNIFLARHQLTDEVEEIAKVVDFGVSKIRTQGTMATKTMGVFGTPHYMAPETTKAQREELDGRVDQWALAVILYRALAGRLPFDNPDPLGVLYQVVNEEPVPLQERCPELPSGITAAIMRGLAKDRDERFPNMAEFVRALDRAAVGVVLPEDMGREGAGRLSASSVRPGPSSSASAAPSRLSNASAPPSAHMSMEMVAEPEDEGTRGGAAYPVADVLGPELVGTEGGRQVGTGSRLWVLALFLAVALASAGAVLVLWQRAAQGPGKEGAGTQRPVPPKAGPVAPVVAPVVAPLVVPLPSKPAVPASVVAPKGAPKPAVVKPARPSEGALEPRALPRPEPQKEDGPPASEGHHRRQAKPDKAVDPGGEDPGEGDPPEDGKTHKKGKSDSEVDKDI